MAVKRARDKLFDNIRHIRFKDLVVIDSPVHAAHTRLRTTSPTRAHHHDFYEFFLVRKGVLTEYRPGALSRLSARTLVFVPPARVHCFACAPGCPEALFTNLAFPTALFNTCMKFISHPKALEKLKAGSVFSGIPVLPWERFLRRADALLPGTGMDFSSRDTVFKALMLDLAEFAAGQAEKEDETGMPAWLSSACAAMREPENLRLGLKRFIGLCGRSQEHVTRTAQRALGLSPTAFINRLRLNRVAERLAFSSARITESAYEAGFNNLAHFNALFRREYGTTPRRYRQMQGREAVP